MKRTWVSMLVGGLFAVTAGGAIAQDQAAAFGEKGMVLTNPVAGPAFTPQQRARLAEKLRMVGDIVAQMEARAAADGLAPGWRQSTMSTLYGLSNETLSVMKGVRSVNDLPGAIAHAKRVAPKALGSQTEDVVYTPITPCRYIDTRDVGGKINGTRSYDLDLNSYTLSGIKCASSPYTTFGSTLAALAVNLAIVDPSGAPGFATIVPNGAATNVALMNWYQSGPTVQASNAAIVTIDQTIGPLDEIDIHTSGPVHAIVDVFGAFRASGATALSCVQQSATSSVAGNGGFGLITATCPAGYTVTGGGYNGASLGANSSWSPENMPSGNGWMVSFYNWSASAFTMEAFAICCRVPGR